MFHIITWRNCMIFWSFRPLKVNSFISFADTFFFTKKGCGRAPFIFFCITFFWRCGRAFLFFSRILRVCTLRYGLECLLNFVSTPINSQDNYYFANVMWNYFFFEQVLTFISHISFPLDVYNVWHTCAVLWFHK